MRRILLWAARNRWMREHLPRWRFVRRAVRRFMPGETPQDALAAAERAQRDGIASTFTLLGENLTEFDQAEAVCALLDQQGFTRVQSRLDLAGIARCSGGQWPGE